jgi:hypothetical protein
LIRRKQPLIHEGARAAVHASDVILRSIAENVAGRAKPARGPIRWLDLVSLTLYPPRADGNGSVALAAAAGFVLSSGRLLPPSPPAEKGTARRDQTGKASTGDRGGNAGRIGAKDTEGA